MLFLICFLLCSSFAYGMDGGYVVNTSAWIKKRRKETKKMEEKYKERLKQEEKLKIKTEKQKAKQEEEQKKLQEKEKEKVEKLQRKLDKKVADLKSQSGTISLLSFVKKKRAELPNFNDEKTKTL